MHEIEIEFDVDVEMRDGTLLKADVYRPVGDGPFPVLVHRTPYGKSTLIDTVLDFKQMVRAGYVLINQDVRGTFASGGEWRPWHHERSDGYDTIEWAAALPYTNGRVGMFGASYHGSTQWSAAISGAPHLKAIAPAITWSDPDDGLMFRGGAQEFGLNNWWGMVQALGQYGRIGLSAEEAGTRTLEGITQLDSLVPEGFWELPSAALPVMVSSGQPDIGVASAFVDHSTTEASRVAGRYDEIQTPSLSFAGWYDCFLQGSLENYIGMQAAGRPARLIIGPWAHTTIMFAWPGGQVGDINFGLLAQAPGGRSYTQIQREWYDHWLKGEPATEAHESGVLIFVMGINEWRAEPTWPLERARDTELYLAEQGALSWSAPTADQSASDYIYDPAHPVITRGGGLSFSSEFPGGPYDQRDAEARDDVLVFTTEALEADLEITGRVRAVIHVSTDGVSTDWVARLCEVDEHGISRNLVDGITRVHTEAGRADEVEIDLWSTSIVIRAGHRLRAHITSSNFPRWDRNLNTGEPETDATTIRVAHQRVFHDRNRPSRLVLPVVAGGVPRD
ncbi:CocE/NonD family hydrolase [Arthrobacter sp. B0490]|uniref:CocE/NonD family hydrolase n=1 Tax=Arthrobacter sp. B0490 TaxID=2058891 RepID=UPI000CE2C599|nr:CocE/NonD family hydrolase [Arthrobacter sp. B0490]